MIFDYLYLSVSSQLLLLFVIMFLLQPYQQSKYHSIHEYPRAGRNYIFQCTTQSDKFCTWVNDFKNNMVQFQRVRSLYPQIEVLDISKTS